MYGLMKEKNYHIWKGVKKQVQKKEALNTQTIPRHLFNKVVVLLDMAASSTGTLAFIDDFLTDWNNNKL